MPKRAVIISNGISNCAAALRNSFCIALLCVACCLIPAVCADDAGPLQHNDGEELFRGTIVKSGSLSVGDLGKILGASLASTSYPCRVKAVQPVSLAASSSLAAGDDILSASVADNMLVLTVNRAGQVFRLTTEIPYYNKSLTGSLTSRHVPLPAIPSLHSDANQSNLLSVLSQPGRRSSAHPKRRAGCSCADNSWCTDQCPSAPYCNCPSMAWVHSYPDYAHPYNPYATCSWSGPNSTQNQDVGAWANRLNGLHRQAQNVQTQRHALEQEIFGQ